MMESLIAENRVGGMIIFALTCGLALSVLRVWFEVTSKTRFEKKRFNAFRELLFQRCCLIVRTIDGLCILPGSNAGTGEIISVRTGEGLVFKVRWLGFVTREDRGRIKGKYVWLDALRMTKERSTEKITLELRDDEYVQGWLTDAGVYAVTDNIVAVVNRSIPAIAPQAVCAQENSC